MTEPTDGMLRMFPDVVVERAEPDEWIAISREAAMVGETLVLDVVPVGTQTDGMREQFRVCVIDSRPVIVNGDMRHRIRLLGGERGPILFEQQVRRG